jgi:hypothetical protein
MLYQLSYAGVALTNPPPSHLSIGFWAGARRANAGVLNRLGGQEQRGAYPVGQSLGQTANFLQTAQEIHVSPGFAAYFGQPSPRRLSTPNAVRAPHSPGVFLRNDPRPASDGGSPHRTHLQSTNRAIPEQARKPLVISNTHQIHSADSRGAVYLVDVAVNFVGTRHAIE